MSAIQRVDSNDRYSQIVISNGIVYLAGQCADDTKQDVKGQTTQVLKEIDSLLAKAGTDKSRILTAQVWLRDIATGMAPMNEAWRAWVDTKNPPTRATGEAKLATADYLVEIIIVAALPGAAVNAANVHPATIAGAATAAVAPAAGVCPYKARHGEKGGKHCDGKKKRRYRGLLKAVAGGIIGAAVVLAVQAVTKSQQKK